MQLTILLWIDILYLLDQRLLSINGCSPIVASSSSLMNAIEDGNLGVDLKLKLMQLTIYCGLVFARSEAAIN